MANYTNFSKATYAQGMVLDPYVREALHRVIAWDADGSRLLLRGVALDAGSTDASPIAGLTNVDLLTLRLDPAGGSVNLNQLPSSTLRGLDIVRFIGEGPANVNLSTFKGVVMLGGGGDNLIATQAVAVQAGAGDDTIVTGAYNDTIAGGLGNDSISTGGGNDNIIGGAGNDTINAGAGSDTVRAGDGDDRVFAGANHDTVFGGLGNDSIYGGNGNDRLFGDAGNDLLDGGFGDDILYTGGGSDTVNGGSGKDNIIVDRSSADDIVTIDGGSDSDVLDLSKVVITQASLTGSLLQVTLDTGAVLNVTNVERFIYDDNGAENPGGKIIVGLTQFLADGDF